MAVNVILCQMRDFIEYLKYEVRDDYRIKVILNDIE